jgi:hypothetical protein
MKRHKKESRNALAASVRTEMAQPRMSKSARMAELESDTARVSQQPRTVMPGTVDKLIPSPTSRLRGKAQISIQGETGYRKLRIENSLTDVHGDEVRLEKGARVEVTVTAEDDFADPKVVAWFTAPRTRRKTMPRRQYCADNLFLLGEMLDMAAGYIGLCDEVLNEEDKPMVELAYDHIHTLKRCTVKLLKELEELEQRVKNKLTQLGDEMASKADLAQRNVKPTRIRRQHMSVSKRW